MDADDLEVALADFKLNETDVFPVTFVFGATQLVSEFFDSGWFGPPLQGLSVFVWIIRGVAPGYYGTGFQP